MDKSKKHLWATAEQLDKARQRRRIDEEIEYELRRDAVDGLMTLLNVDRESFRRFWIQPLLTAGATLDMALASIAQSQFQPN